MTLYNTLEIMPAKTMNELIPTDIREELKNKDAEAADAGFTHGKYEGIEEQLPAMFLVDSNGIVKFVHYAKNLLDNPDIDEMPAMI